MSYTTWDTLVSKYPGLASKNANSPEVALSFLPGAQAEIDGRLCSKYAVPFSPVPDLIKDLCTDLIYAKITIRDQKLSKPVMDYYEKRMVMLEKGTLQIVVDGVANDLSNGASVDKSYHSVFGMDDPIKWQPDTDSLNDLEDARNDD